MRGSSTSISRRLRVRDCSLQWRSATARFARSSRCSAAVSNSAAGCSLAIKVSQAAIASRKFCCAALTSVRASLISSKLVTALTLVTALSAPAKFESPTSEDLNCSAAPQWAASPPRVTAKRWPAGPLAETSAERFRRPEIQGRRDGPICTLD
jgi:hypothetical protein